MPCQANAPLFVNSSKNNFYLVAGSLAVDTAINTVPERANLQVVTSPMGIPPSPIQAPDDDLLGQSRDANSNLFKDRGAIERVDTLGPVATLVNPVDNDPVHHQVQLAGQTLNSFDIQFSDAGVGVDDSTIDISKFTLTFNGVNVPSATGFTLQYDTTNNLAKLIPPTGVWANGTYVITVNNSIKDLANNNLQPNQLQVTQFTITLSTTVPAKFQNPTNRFDVNNDGHVFPNDLVIVINDLIRQKVESAPDGTGGTALGAGGLIDPNTPLSTPPTYPNVSGVELNGTELLTPSDVNQLITALNNPGLAQSTTSSQSVASASTDSSSVAVASSAAVAPARPSHRARR